jgi:hypothetical protein
MADADLTLVVVDLSSPLEDQDRELLTRARNQGRWLLAETSRTCRAAPCSRAAIEVSALTGAGIELCGRRSHPKSTTRPGS